MRDLTRLRWARGIALDYLKEGRTEQEVRADLECCFTRDVVESAVLTHRHERLMWEHRQ